MYAPLPRHHLTIFIHKGLLSHVCLSVCRTARRSLTYEHRLYKYSLRGFGVAAPMVDFSRVDPRIFATSNNMKDMKGLKQLLLLDFKVRFVVRHWCA